MHMPCIILQGKGRLALELNTYLHSRMIWQTFSEKQDMMKLSVMLSIICAVRAYPMKASDKESSPFSLVGKQLHRVTSLEARMRTNLEKRGAEAKKRGTFVVLTDDMVQEAKVKALQAGVDGVNQNCAAYTDLVTPWMTQNNKTCDGWDWLANVGYNTRCDSDTQSGGDSWVANQYCWKTCCELGVGYTPGEIQEETKTAIDNLTKTEDD